MRQGIAASKKGMPKSFPLMHKEPSGRAPLMKTHNATTAHHPKAPWTLLSPPLDHPKSPPVTSPVVGFAA